MKSKNWLIKERGDLLNDADQINLDILKKVLLSDRGLETDDQIQEFLTPDYDKNVHDPFLFSQMESAVERIFLAIEKKEKIYIFGDYDADGVSGSVILTNALTPLGADISVYLPHREKEGYGLSEKGIDFINSQGANLIITTDCGISNYNQVEYAKSLQLDVIVTDHHQAPDTLPDCIIIHPDLKNESYPFKKLAGGGVAFKLSQALLRTKAKQVAEEEVESSINWAGKEKWLLDMVAVATVADIMPLLGENRTLVKYGLIVLNKARRLGMKDLLTEIGLLKDGLDSLNLNSDHIGFQIAPRINAAGRMDHASIAYELMTSDDQNYSKILSKQLNENNQQRQQLVKKIMTDALSQIDYQENQKKKILFAYHPEWALGVAGLVAGKLKEMYYLPAVVAADLDGKIVGSVRSIEGFNFVDALTQVNHYFEKFGGHSMACGFTLKDKKHWENLQNDLNQIMFSSLKEEEYIPNVDIDFEIPLSLVSWDLIKYLDKFEPYGKANPKPLFLSQKVNVVQIRAIGEKGNHLKLVISDNNVSHPVIGFGFGEWENQLNQGDSIDIIYELSINEWNGNREIQLRLVDLRKHSA